MTAPMVPPPATQPQHNNGFAITALVLGIVGLCIALIPIVGIVAWPIVILGVIFGSISLAQALRNRASKGLAIAGLVCAAVGLAFCIIYLMALTASVARTATQQHTVQPPPLAAPTITVPAPPPPVVVPNPPPVVTEYPAAPRYAPRYEYSENNAMGVSPEAMTWLSTNWPPLYSAVSSGDWSAVQSAVYNSGDDPGYHYRVMSQFREKYPDSAQALGM
jgi:hypothetical protein